MSFSRTSLPCPFSQMGNESATFVSQPQPSASQETCRSYVRVPWHPPWACQSLLTGSRPDRTAITLTWVQSPGSVQNPCCIAGSPRTNGSLLGAPVTLSGQRRRHIPKSIRSVARAPGFAWLAPGSCQETKMEFSLEVEFASSRIHRGWQGQKMWSGGNWRA